MGIHWTSCTFTMQQIGRWVVTHSLADSNLRGHCLAISRKQCPLWILGPSPTPEYDDVDFTVPARWGREAQTLNPASALSDHRKSVPRLISNNPHSAAYSYKLGPNRVKAECLCAQKAATISQHTHTPTDCTWPQPPTTKDMKTLVMPA